MITVGKPSKDILYFKSRLADMKRRPVMLKASSAHATKASFGASSAMLTPAIQTHAKAHAIAARASYTGRSSCSNRFFSAISEPQLLHGKA